METTFFIAIAGIIIVLLIFCIPAYKIARSNSKLRLDEINYPIKSPEIFYFILMPLEGLVCYHLLDDMSMGIPELDWKYFAAVVGTPIVISAYFISRLVKHEFNLLVKVVILFIFLIGIGLAIGMGIRFYLIGALGAVLIITPGIIFTLLALPYYSLLPVIILLAVEGYNLINSPYPAKLNTNEE